MIRHLKEKRKKYMEKFFGKDILKEKGVPL
jgi:hypothetical protein